MGSISAMGMKEQVGEGNVSIDTALSWHLTSNHYPPIPSYMIPVAKRAIAKANRGEWEKKVRLPKDVEHRVYGKLVPVHEVVSHMHLDCFLDQDDDEFLSETNHLEEY